MGTRSPFRGPFPAQRVRGAFRATRRDIRRRTPRTRPVGLGSRARSRRTPGIRSGRADSPGAELGRPSHTLHGPERLACQPCALQQALASPICAWGPEALGAYRGEGPDRKHARRPNRTPRPTRTVSARRLAPRRPFKPEFRGPQRSGRRPGGVTASSRPTSGWKDSDSCYTHVAHRRGHSQAGLSQPRFGRGRCTG